VRQPCHPTIRVLKILIVGALTSCRPGQSGAAPDRSCSLSGVPLTPALTSARTVHTFADDRCTSSRAPLGAPDSPW
jgi:streptogramin lyase